MKSNKGRPKLYHEGVFYTSESRSGTGVIWKCEITGNRTTTISGGRVATSLNVTPPVEQRKDYNHLSVPEKLVSLEAVQEMLSRAKISADKSRIIMKNSKINVDKEAVAILTRPKIIQRRIVRIRAKKVDHGPNPVSLMEILIPDALQLTYDGGYR